MITKRRYKAKELEAEIENLKIENKRLLDELEKSKFANNELKDFSKSFKSFYEKLTSPCVKVVSSQVSKISQSYVISALDNIPVEVIKNRLCKTMGEALTHYVKFDIDNDPVNPTNKVLIATVCVVNPEMIDKEI